MSTVDRTRLAELMDRERASFAADHPRSQALYESAQASLLAGVPMNWMQRWAGGFPIFVASANGAHFTDVDDHEYVDFCLGDTGAMTGHSPPAAVGMIAEQAARGITTLLPTEDSLWVGSEMARRFGLPYWQFSLTATDANRFVIRLARHVTGRPKILVYNGCYHGSVDETVVMLDDGRLVPRRGSVGPPVDPQLTTRAVEFNDITALERELDAGDVACVLAEPVMTNIGIVLPDRGYHDALRRLTAERGVLLVIDETHTLCCGPGGYTATHGLQPDVITLGKSIGSGIPSGCYGLSADLAARITSTTSVLDADVGGVGGTLSGNALSLAAIRATLQYVLTDQAFAHMIPLAERFTKAVERVIAAAQLPWHVTRLGCRVEYRFSSDRPRTGGEAGASEDSELDAFMHLYMMNRCILMTPFHNMALMSPATSAADVERHTEVFAEAVAELTAV
jgi:glutamate-1-semialdehyde 2,1-aminomutase